MKSSIEALNLLLSLDLVVVEGKRLTLSERAKEALKGGFTADNLATYRAIDSLPENALELLNELANVPKALESELEETASERSEGVDEIARLERLAREIREEMKSEILDFVRDSIRSAGLYRTRRYVLRALYDFSTLSEKDEGEKALDELLELGELVEVERIPGEGPVLSLR